MRKRSNPRKSRTKCKLHNIVYEYGADHLDEEARDKFLNCRQDNAYTCENTDCKHHVEGSN